MFIIDFHWIHIKLVDQLHCCRQSGPIRPLFEQAVEWMELKHIAVILIECCTDSCKEKEKRSEGKNKLCTTVIEVSCWNVFWIVYLFRNSKNKSWVEWICQPFYFCSIGLGNVHSPIYNDAEVATFDFLEQDKTKWPWWLIKTCVWQN